MLVLECPCLGVENSSNSSTQVEHPFYGNQNSLPNHKL